MRIKTLTRLPLEGLAEKPAKEKQAQRKNAPAEVMGNWVEGRLVLSPKQNERFWSNVEKTETCWNWKASKTWGYGVMKYTSSRGIKKMVRAHRVSYSMAFGKIGTGLLVCHKCDNRACVNPDHLFAGDFRTNGMDAAAKGRTAKQLGENHGMNKLRNEDVLEIREKYSIGNVSQQQLASRFGVSQGMIWLIVKRKNWKHI